MRKAWNLIWRLSLICIIAAVSLGITNELTKGPIAEQNMKKENAAFLGVMTPDATDFQTVENPPEGIDKALEGLKDGAVVGYAAQVTVKGYGGNIQVVAGMDKNGVITGITVGGPEFKETQGLGAKTKEPAFTDQFKTKTAPVKLGTDVQAVSGATISSTAVTNAVNTAGQYMGELLGVASAVPEEPAVEAYKAVLPDAVDFEQAEAAQGIDLAYAGKKDGETVGYSAQVTVKGFGGNIQVTVGMDMTGAITGVSVGGPEFAETPGLGAKTQEPAFTDQFKTKTAPVVLGTDVDAVSGATVSSTAVTNGVNTASEFLKGLIGLSTETAGEPAEEVEPYVAVMSPDAAEFEQIEAAEGIDLAYAGKKDGAVIGYAAQVTVDGFGGKIQVTVGMDLTGAITGVSVGGPNFSETPGLGAKTKDAAFTDQFKTKTAPLTLGSDIDAVSGATISSTAVVKAVNSASLFLAGLIG
jgi:RnfABCDGE-type electron transport complex G subunit